VFGVGGGCFCFLNASRRAKLLRTFFYVSYDAVGLPRTPAPGHRTHPNTATHPVQIQRSTRSDEIGLRGDLRSRDQEPRGRVETVIEQH